MGLSQFAFLLYRKKLAIFREQNTFLIKLEILRKKDVELLKNIQIKIILVLVIVGIVVISGIGFFSISTTEKLKDNIVEKEAIEIQIRQNKMLFISRSIYIYCYFYYGWNVRK